MWFSRVVCHAGAAKRNISWRNKKATEIQNKNTYKMEIEVDKVDINVDVENSNREIKAF